MSKDISRTLIIGLGGTGQSVIREIKKRLFRRYGEIPSLVKFLSFDTDNVDYQDTDFQYYYNGENRITRKYNITKAEFKKVARPSIEVLKADPNCAHLNFEQLGKIYGLANAIGANGYRVMGRAHFLYEANNIMTQLENTVTNLQNAQLAQAELANGYSLANGSTTVYIIASLAGGTGSSSFLDLSRMLQHAGIDILPRGGNAPSDNIMGVFFMPSFFSTKANTPNVKANTYVALSELDYLLGLNDEERYPDGCIEKENDLNIYGPNTAYKSVRFSNVYLIDEKTRQGHTHSFEEASGYVASFIAASIAADNTALQGSYSNSTHRLHDVEGKKQLYSGLGFCEIRFDRQNLVKYLLNKQLREVLSEYKTTTLDVDRIADVFIAENHLNEGVMSSGEDMEDTRAQLNELTDSIFELTDKRLTGIPMTKVKTGKKAAEEIEAGRVKYLTKINAEIGEVKKGFAKQKKIILENLTEMLNKRQTEIGFGCIPDLAKRLKSAFEAMKLGLEDEITQHENSEKSIETTLKKIKTTIASNSSGGFLGIGSQREAQEAAIKSYYSAIENIGTETKPTLLRVKLEIARKKMAIDVYDELIKKVEDFYKEEEIELAGDKTAIQVSGSAMEIQKTYDALKKTVESEFLSYAYSKSAKNETIFVDAYFKEYFDTHKNESIELNEQARNELEQFIQQIFIDKPSVDKELIAKMRMFILDLLPDNVLIKRIQREDLSLDQLFVHCFGRADEVDDDHDLNRYPHLGLFAQMDTLFDSLWQYNDFRGGNCQAVALQCVVGVNDTNAHLFDITNKYNNYLPSSHAYQYINVGDPDRILFILQETAIPGFKMREASGWKSDYESKKDNTYSFSDKRLEDIDLMFPDTTDEKGDIAWAYGWLFGLIASVAGRIQVKPSQAYLTKTQQVPGNSGYLDYFATRKQRASNLSVCHKQFVRDEKLFEDIYEQVMELLDSDKNGSMVKIAHWINDGLLWENRGKLRTSMDGDERWIVQNETESLKKRFARLNSPQTAISINSQGKIEFKDSLGVIAEAEKLYKASQEQKG